MDPRTKLLYWVIRDGSPVLVVRGLEQAESIRSWYAENWPGSKWAVEVAR